MTKVVWNFCLPTLESLCATYQGASCSATVFCGYPQAKINGTHMDGMYDLGRYAVQSHDYLGLR